MDQRTQYRRKYRRLKSGSAPEDRWSGGEVTMMLQHPPVEDRDTRLARLQARRDSRRRRRRRGRVLLAIALCLAVLVAGMALKSMQETVVYTMITPSVSPLKQVPSKPPSSESSSEAETVYQQSNSELAGDPAALKQRIKEIAAYYGGDYGVIISDPYSGERVSLGADQTFFAASIGKIPTLLSLYKAADRGQVDLDERISILPSDLQSYGTGVLHTYPIGTTMTLRECAYYLMNKSDNTAWAMLTRYLGAQKIQADLASIGANGTGYWIPNTTTAEDVMAMLREMTDPSSISPDLSKEMLDSMTDTVFEDRITGGLPEDVRVAHKIGTYGTSFSDAGIVFYKDRDGSEKHYYIVVLTEGMGETTAREAIQEISAAAHHTFGPVESGS